jgi:hypothetical protein
VHAQERGGGRQVELELLDILVRRQVLVLRHHQGGEPVAILGSHGLLDRGVRGHARSHGARPLRLGGDRVGQLDAQPGQLPTERLVAQPSGDPQIGGGGDRDREQGADGQRQRQTKADTGRSRSLHQPTHRDRWVIVRCNNSESLSL